MDRRKILALGLAGALVAVEVMQPPLIISLPLLLASLFLVAWAIVPGTIRHWASNSGPFSPYLLRGLDGVDRMLSQIVADESERDECLSRLADKMNEGGRLLNRRVKNEAELVSWKSDYDA